MSNLSYLLAVLALSGTMAKAEAPAASAAPPVSAPAPVSLDVLSWSPGMVHASLSPDGRYIATVDYFFGHSVKLAEVKNLEFKVIAESKTAHEGFYTFSKTPRSVSWIGNDVIAINYNKGATALNREGKFVADLGERFLEQVSGTGGQSAGALVYTDVEEGQLARVNLQTGKKTLLRLPMSGKPIDFAFDSRGDARAVTMIDASFWQDATSISNWFKPSGKREWIKLAEFKVTDDYWLPLYVPDEEDKLVISSRVGRDTYAIFDYDTRTRTIGEMMAGHPSVDILGAAGLDQDAFESVWTSGMQPQQIWFNPKWDALQQSVDKALPDRINRMSGDPANKVLVFSRGDVDPGTYYLLDTTKMELRKIGSYHTLVKPAEMRPMKSISYPAMDGLKIPAFLTLPAAASRSLPTVIMIHGGPTARDAWAFDADVQLLASRGYAVLQPQFRGSSGFGRKFEEAGYGQWGLAMQDDITAGVDYLVKQQIADPDRVCIYGASYGGYAALWGLVKTPELFRCGISFAGVVDLELMFTDASDRTSNKATLELMRSRIGDVKLNKQQFDQVSPLKHAARIVAPVLLMHGAEDERVPIVHGKKMHQALLDAGKRVEWISFAEEGHGLYKYQSQQQYFKALLAFLDAHIGSRAAAVQNKRQD